jgi:hypothetical protein
LLKKKEIKNAEQNKGCISFKRAGDEKRARFLQNGRLYLLEDTQDAYVFAADHRALARGGVVRALVLVDAPVARPLRAHALPAGGVSAAVVVGEVAADEVLVGLRRAHRQRHQHVVLLLGDLGPLVHRRRHARQPARRHAGVDRLGAAENALVLGTRRQVGQRPDRQLHLGVKMGNLALKNFEFEKSHFNPY